MGRRARAGVASTAELGDAAGTAATWAVCRRRVLVLFGTTASAEVMFLAWVCWIICWYVGALAAVRSQRRWSVNWAKGAGSAAGLSAGVWRRIAGSVGWVDSAG